MLLSKVSVWQMALLGALLVLTNTMNAISVNADNVRVGIELEAWKPFVWEYSSGLMLWLLAPLLAWAIALFPLTRTHWWRSLPAHLVMTVPYSLIHVGGMVSIRRLVYSLADDSYSFGPWWPNWQYEFNKDFSAYWIILVILLASHSYMSRGQRHEEDASADGNSASDRLPVGRLVVRKRNREFVLSVEEIERIDADGNYARIHARGDVFRVRESLASLEKRLDASKFARVHRRHIVNIDSIREIQPWDSGDYRILLNDGNLVNLSRRYRVRLSHLFS